MSYAFPTDAKEGDIVTLENGVAYQYDEAKDRWLVKAVAGSGSGGDWGFPLPGDEVEYATLEHSDTRDNLLQAEIEELTLVVGDALSASQRDHGAWQYVGDGLQAYPSQDGTFTLASNDLSGTLENNVVFNTTDLDGKVHGFGDIDVGEYLEIVDEEHPEQYALWVVNEEPQINGVLCEIKVKLKKAGKEGFDLNDRCQVRFIQIQESNLDLAELDERYAGKQAEHLNISHQTENTAWYNAPHKFLIDNSKAQQENWSGAYYRLAHDESQKGLLALSTKSATQNSPLTFESWSTIVEGTDRWLRNTSSRLDDKSLLELTVDDVGSVIVMRQDGTGAELSLHVKNVNFKILTVDGVETTEHACWVRVRRKRGAPSEDGEWRVYLQKEHLSAKGHDHYIGRLNTREDRTLIKWKSLGSNQFAISDRGSNPQEGDGSYLYKDAKWFKVWGGQFSDSTISGDYQNGLGIVSLQKGNTFYASYLTASNVQNNSGDHCWRVAPLVGDYLGSMIAGTHWDSVYTVGTNGLLQNTRTKYKTDQKTNVYTVGSPDEDIENPERPVWTGDNFGDFKSLNEFVAELKSADTDGSTIEFLMEQWQTYWYTPGR